MDQVTTILADHAEKNALAKFSLDRDDTDSYNLNLEHYTLGDGGPISHLKSSDLMNLLPAGTSFRKVVGWRSIFGSQFQCGKCSVVAIGIEQIVAHSTRGAFPCSSVYIYANLGIAAGGLNGLLSDLPMPAPNAAERYNIYACDSATPAEHRIQEASTIACARRYWDNGSHFLFRTLLIDESTLRLPGHPGPPIGRVSSRGGKYEVDKWLICTTPVVRSECGVIASGWMRAYKWRRVPGQV